MDNDEKRGIVHNTPIYQAHFDNNRETHNFFSLNFIDVLFCKGHLDMLIEVD